MPSATPAEMRATVPTTLGLFPLLRTVPGRPPPPSIAPGVKAAGASSTGATFFTSLEILPGDKNCGSSTGFGTFAAAAWGFPAFAAGVFGEGLAAGLADLPVLTIGKSLVELTAWGASVCDGAATGVAAGCLKRLRKISSSTTTSATAPAPINSQFFRLRDGSARSSTIFILRNNASSSASVSIPRFATGAATGKAFATRLSEIVFSDNSVVNDDRGLASTGLLAIAGWSTRGWASSE